MLARAPTITVNPTHIPSLSIQPQIINVTLSSRVQVSIWSGVAPKHKVTRLPRTISIEDLARA